MIQKTPLGYRPLDIQTLPAYLAKKIADNPLIDGSPADWLVEEVGDGNLNLVFIVRGLTKALVVKQALPYVRAAGESWPMSLQRAYFEYHALTEQHRVAKDWVPDIYFYDPDMALFTMEYLPSHLILRKGFIAGTIYPNLANDIGHFLAKTLFYTSDLGMPAEKKKAHVARFAANSELCKITEDLIFTEPYYNAERNNWNRPALDKEVAAMWQDDDMINVAMQYKWKFMTEAQALLHGDLHSGSVMVNQNETKIIDPEFSFFGPMAFDIGNYLGNLLMAYFSQSAHRKTPCECKSYQQWLLKQLVDTWEIFEHEFRSLWNENRTQHKDQTGDAWPTTLYPESETADKRHLLAQDHFFATLFTDTLVNAGLEMNRRTVGFAGVADLKSIQNAEIRACCERKVLVMARQIIVTPERCKTIKDVAELAQKLEETR